MKEKKKKKGGQRVGAGRKPSGRLKEAVTVYTDVSKFGGKEGARMAIYEFLDGKINLTGKSSFVPLDIPPSIQKKFPPSDLEIKQKAPKEEKKPTLADSKPQEQPMPKLEAAISEAAQKAIREQIAAIRAEKIPPERNTPMGKKAWQIDQQKRIQELQNKL